MTAFASDIFTGIDDDALDGQAMVLGGPWVLHPSYPAYYTGYLGNKGSPITNFGTGCVYATTGAPSADYAVQVDLTTQTAGSEGACGVIGRAASGAHTFYVLDYYDHATAGSRQFRLFKMVAGSYTGLDTYTYNLGSSATVALKLEMIDTAIKGYVDGVEQLSATDSSITAAGYAGVRLGAEANYTLAPRVDNFVAATPGAGPVGTRRSFGGFRGFYTR